MLRRFLLLVTLTLATSLAAPAFAAGPETFVKNKQAELVKLLKSNGDDKKVEGVFNSMLDYDALANLSLEDYWGQLSSQERSEFTAVLRTLVQRAYKKNIKKTLDYDVSYKGEGQSKQGHVVRTVAKNKSKPREEPVSIDYVLHQVGGQWRIFDIVTEGSSLVGNYKSQFRRVIEKEDNVKAGFQRLMSKMKDKAAEKE